MKPRLFVLVFMTSLSIALTSHPIEAQFGQIQPQTRQVKELDFTDPNTGSLYRVISHNVTIMTTDGTYRSSIKVSRVELDSNGHWTGRPKPIQTLNFHPSLVDFDIDCVPSHCYLVAVTSKTKQNVELFSWQRTQFDRLAVRDSFARAHAVQLFRIQSGFYIAVAQDQLHLTSIRLTYENEESMRFIGCAIFKFYRGQEHKLKYHQFIKLPFNPYHVNYVPAINPNNITLQSTTRSSENHYLIFSAESNWQSASSVVSSFIWSPLNDHFWPYRLPMNVTVTTRPGTVQKVLNFPSDLHIHNYTKGQVSGGRTEPIELCFHQLQRLLAEREVHARRLIESSQSLWRSSRKSLDPNHPQLANISARVIVHGDVIVRGSMIESPQISLLGGYNRPPLQQIQQLTRVVDAHSPAIVESRLRQAKYRLDHIRDKLSKAVSANLLYNNTRFDSRIKFYTNIFANRVIFGASGISNSDVRLNGIPFRQLERELVSLQGAQNIAAKVLFRGNVFADSLEIHGRINDEEYLLQDAVDITSRRVQVIETSAPTEMQFVSISAPELIMAPNVTLNDITLDDFITRDGRDQLIRGGKSFRHLSMRKLDLADPDVLLNGININRLAKEAIRLQLPRENVYQTINGKVLFTKPIRANRLIVNNVINGRINLTSLIHESVKANEPNMVQAITGQKFFLQGLKIANLRTEGAINGILMNQVFNLNLYPPVADYEKYINPDTFLKQPPVTGTFTFAGPVDIKANLNANLVNDVDISRRAIRRTPMTDANRTLQNVSGHKTFLRPLRILNRVRIFENNQRVGVQPNNYTRHYPLINGIDFKLITAGINRQRQSPSPIYIENLDIDGNFHLNTGVNYTSGSPRTTLGNFTTCPLHHFRSKVVLAGPEEQVIDAPIRIGSLRARSIYSEPGALNGYTFPHDFVLRSTPNLVAPTPLVEQPVEFVFGHKYFDRLIVTPALMENHNLKQSMISNLTAQNHGPGIVFGSLSSINNITYDKIQTFVVHERRQNSTGETIIQNLNVYGNIHARKINNHYWPEDVLLKGVSANVSPAPQPYLDHRRIYSPLILLNSSFLKVQNQLVLRGPVQLGGKMNGVNLTQLAQQSVTYGDKDLYSVGRPIRNKIFLGGITVTGEIRSMGLIDSINIEEMRQRVVTIGPSGKIQFITGPKQLLSDINFIGPLKMLYLGDLALDENLKRIQFVPGTNHIQVFKKKSMTGALRINNQLIVNGLINGIKFEDLRAKAIPLSPQVDQLTFNKTFTIEGDVFVDNLQIDEKNGIIDGVKLTNLLPIEYVGKNELVVDSPSLTRENSTHGMSFKVAGSVQDCEMVCNLVTKEHYLASYGGQSPPKKVEMLPVPQQMVAYPPRPIYYLGRNMTYMRTTPPYATQPIGFYPTPTPIRPVIPLVDQKMMQNLAAKRPTAITYERSRPPRKMFAANTSQAVAEQIELLKNHIVSLNLIRLSPYIDLIIGFIDSPTNDISNFRMLEPEGPFDHIPEMKSFLVLDHINYMFRLTATYHLTVGVHIDQTGQNVTGVYTSIGGGNVHLLSRLPVEAPNSAMFFKTNQDVLFLLVSQDYMAQQNRQRKLQCPSYVPIQSNGIVEYNHPQPLHHPVIEGVHVYLFHSLQNSSSLNSAYFDLYQTIDLPAIDSFEKISYHGSTYVIAVSRQTNKIHLLLLRGYSGFQVVSHINMPMIESVQVIYTEDDRPTLLIHQTDGLHRLMDPVMI